VLVDALVLKIREEGRVRSRSALIAVGINEAGFKSTLAWLADGHLPRENFYTQNFGLDL